MSAKECRICGKVSNLLSVFGHVDGETMCDKIKMIAKVKITTLDNLPKFICIGCIGRVNNCIDFKRQIQFSNRICYTTSVNENGPSDETLSARETENNSHEDTLSDHNASDPEGQANSVGLERIPSPIPCEECNIVSPTVEEFLAHKQRHSRPSYQCDICEKVLASTKSFKLHKLRHTGVKPFSCQTCGKAFYAMKLLKEHIRTHTGDKRYSCLICDRKFCQATAVRMHMRGLHSTYINQLFMPQ